VHTTECSVFLIKAQYQKTVAVYQLKRLPYSSPQVRVIPQLMLPYEQKSKMR